MKLPRPQEKLAGCVWLPRIIGKARQFQGGALPKDYEVRFCHPTGVDGHFLSHFGLSREDILFIATLSDEQVSEWFLARSAAERIEQWNQVATNFGRPGYPFAERLSVTLTTTYKRVAGRGLTTVFEVLEADDNAA